MSAERPAIEIDVNSDGETVSITILIASDTHGYVRILETNDAKHLMEMADEFGKAQADLVNIVLQHVDGELIH